MMTSIQSIVESSMERLGLSRLDEISKETKKAYIDAALDNLETIGNKRGALQVAAFDPKNKSKEIQMRQAAGDMEKRANKRKKGIKLATKMNEGVLNEISDDLKKRYTKKALKDLKVSAHLAGSTVERARAAEDQRDADRLYSSADRYTGIASKRMRGINRAVSKLGEAADDESSNLLVSRGFVTPHVAKKLADASTFVQRDKNTNESHYFHPKHGHFVLVPHKSGQYQLRTKKEPSELLKEDTLTELSPQTLGSYIKNADIDRAAASGMANAERAIAIMTSEDGKPDEHYMTKSDKAQSRSQKRFRGILRATDKLVGKAHRPADLRESVRAHGIPQYLYNLGKELGSDLGFHKESRMINPKTNSKDYVFHVDRLSDAAKERIKKDYPEAVLGLSSGSQFAPEHQNPIIVIPGKSRRKDIIYGDSMTEAESLNELSPSTLGDYIKHATIDNGAAHGVAGAERAIARMSGTVDHPDEHYMDQAEKETARANKRFRGILRATNKLVAKTHSVKEVEEFLEGDTLNELSKETLGRYITKAAKDISLRSYLAGNHEPGREKIEVTLKHIDKSHKHTKGIEMAVKKLTEAAPPDMEDWVRANKAKFVKQYGDKKGHEILYATAWKMHNEKGE